MYARRAVEVFVIAVVSIISTILQSPGRASLWTVMSFDIYRLSVNRSEKDDKALCWTHTIQDDVLWYITAI